MQRCIAFNIQPWREDDWLVEIISVEGRSALIVKAQQSAPTLFTEYLAAWGSAPFASAKLWQPQQTWTLTGEAAFCGLYLNELLALLLPEREPTTELYQHYQNTLVALSQPGLFEPWLRLFEMQLLHTLGYGFVWHQDCQGRSIRSNEHYLFLPSRGFQRQPQAQAYTVLGADLLAFHAGSNELKHWRMARGIMRQALTAILPRPLLSRELLNPSAFLLE